MVLPSSAGDGSPSATVVIVGGGIAGASAAQALRQAGFSGRIRLLGAESLPPYERPPLSKEYLLGRTPPEKLLLLPPAEYAARGIELLPGVRAVGLDRAAREVLLDVPP